MDSTPSSTEWNNLHHSGDANNCTGASQLNSGYQPGLLNEMVADLTRPNMPWNVPSQLTTYMTNSSGNDFSRNSTTYSNSSGQNPGLAWKKRKKKNDPCSLPRKIFISEEKMAECMKNLYIDERIKKRASWYCTSQEEAMKIIQDIDSRLCLEDEDIEVEIENDKSQQRFEICEALKDQMLTWPKLMNETKPCMEVVLWKCPSTVLQNVENTRKTIPTNGAITNISSVPAQPAHVDFKPISVPKVLDSSDTELMWDDENDDLKMDL